MRTTDLIFDDLLIFKIVFFRNKRIENTERRNSYSNMINMIHVCIAIRIFHEALNSYISYLFNIDMSCKECLLLYGRHQTPTKNPYIDWANTYTLEFLHSFKKLFLKHWQNRKDQIFHICLSCLSFFPTGTL